MRNILMAIAILTFTSNVFAMEFSGTIFRNSHIYLELDSGRRIPLAAGTQIVEETLRRLSNGDAIKLLADEIDGGLLCQQIHFVHIRRFLGVWQGSDSSLLVVRNFEKLFRWKNPNLRHNKANRETFTYNMTPDSDERWGLLMVGTQSVLSGFVEFRNNTMNFEFTDSSGKNKVVKFHRVTP